MANVLTQTSLDGAKKGDLEKSPDLIDRFLLEKGLGSIYCTWSEDRIRQKLLIDDQISKFVAGDCRGAVLNGKRGAGKTVILHYIAKSIIERSHLELWGGQNGVAVINSGRVYEIKFIRNNRIAHLIMEKKFEELSEFENANLLFIDDFARLYQHDYPISRLEEFIEFRYSKLLPTFISMDITLKTLSERQDWEAMTDRFRDKKWMFGALEIEGDSQR